LRIAHVTATFPPYFAGTGNVAFHNARTLARRGHEVTVYTARLPGAADAEQGAFRVRRLRSLIRIGNAPLLPGLSRLHGYDLVHLHYPFIFGAELVWFVGQLRHQRYVVTYHNDLLATGLKEDLFRLYDFTWAGRVLKGARAIIVPALDWAQTSATLRRLLADGVEPVVEVPHGVDTDLFRPIANRRQLRPGLGIDDTSDPVALFVGRMDSAHESKGGVPVLLEAMTRLKTKDVRLVLAGGGDRIPAYRRLASRLGLDGRARFLGTVAPDDMPALYAASDIVVQPSVRFETFGLVALEAMACGIPVIASELPGARQVVRDAGGGVLVRPGDTTDLASKMDMLLNDSNLQLQLSSSGRAAAVTRYDWARIGTSLEAVYRRALERP
jgi:glycosyltransferase involved in cell wall biosynthesis